MSITLSEPELRAWLRLNLEPGLDGARLRQLLAHFGLPQDICAASTGSLSRYLDPSLAARLSRAPSPQQTAAIENALRWCDQNDHHVLTLADQQYPQVLFELPDPPALLFAWGRLDTLNAPAIAVVGSRAATPEGEENAHAFARYLATRGWCIVSGLASGIDGAAHRGALAAGPDGAGTLAVLGTGIDAIYPRHHLALAQHVARQGLLISEFPLGSPARPFHFPRRNRLVAALSRGVLVVQAAKRSGSLITARQAGELGREVFAIPGSIHSPLSHGCHALIRQGAKLVESGQDILEELQQASLPGVPSKTATPGPSRPPSRPAENPVAPAAALPLDHDGRALLKQMGHEPADPDVLLQRTGWHASRLTETLTQLELDGWAERQADGRYRRRLQASDTAP